MTGFDEERTRMVSARFGERFGEEPEIWARAPGRVDLMGSHTDYNSGYVLTLPISRDLRIAARMRHGGVVRAYSLNLESECRFDLDGIAHDPSENWSNYIRGVAAILQQERFRLRGFDAAVHSTVPIGSGLASSAALECATAIVFQALGGWKLEPAGMAQLCQRAENQFVGVNCGILDQYTSCLGREGCALLLDCRDLSTREVRIPDSLRVVICDTRSPRRLSASEYGERRAQCEEGARLLGAPTLRDLTFEQFQARKSELPTDVAKRCEFIIGENARVLRLAEALPAADMEAIRDIFAGSFRGARDLFEICASSMLFMINAMLGAPGVIGARQAGAGFGGCMVALVDSARTGEFCDAVLQSYLGATGIVPEVFPVDAAPGAGLMAGTGAKAEEIDGYVAR